MSIDQQKQQQELGFLLQKYQLNNVLTNTEMLVMLADEISQFAKILKNGESK